MRQKLYLFASIVCLASIASAEPPVGSRLGERLESKKVEEDRERAAGAHEMANCLVGRKSREVQAYLSATTAEESKKLGGRIGGEVSYCFMSRPMNDLVEAQRIAYPAPILRGMLAEHLVKTNRSAFAQLPALPIRNSYSRPWFEASFRNIAVNEMATCVAETNPAGVLTLLETEPYSDSEQAAISVLMPFLGSCLTAGTKLSGEREPLRAALAEALYQRVNFPGEALAQEASQ